VGVVVDTHSAVWYLLASNRLSREALRALEAATRAGDPVYLPSISVVEVIYLVEKGRLPQLALERLNDALADSESAFVLLRLI
jgi:PIN domain nuclease of toxin-antitoxin system